MEGVPAELQPVAHALVQTREEVREFTSGFPDESLWQGAFGLAPVGYHLKHIAGVIDRLFAQAEGRAVGAEMLSALKVERAHGEPEGATTASLVAEVDAAVSRGLEQLRRTDPRTLYEPRSVGSKKLPSTVAGMLFHAAEHAQRHCGQLLVTTRAVRSRHDRSLGAR